MYSELKKIRFSRLRKLELSVLAKSVIEIVEKNDPETLRIKELFDSLVEQKPHIEHLDVGYGPHPITTELDSLRQQRIAYSQGIMNQMKTIERGKMEGMKESLKVAQPVANLYLKNLSRNSSRIITEKVIRFFNKIEESEALETAFDTLDLTTYLDQLQSVNSTLIELFNNRRFSISERPKGMTPFFVKSITDIMRKLFLQIELAQFKNPELNYTPLIDELNDELISFEKTINMRASYNKKKAEEIVDDNDVVIDDDESEEEIETTESGTRMYPMNEEVETMENSDELDKERTVAVSSGQAQPPIVSTEA